ncbi:MAG: hypothetical protein A2W17_00145 [Planctomycetes bacterium RBG_16_41_13]|nr:MAG: hypothetical protein A2W17_00145 [Planctomycetes bacterium RBG_16_41_13]
MTGLRKHTIIYRNVFWREVFFQACSNLERIMGGIYGKLTITAFILFVAIQVGFIIMCVAFGRRNKNVSKP